MSGVRLEELKAKHRVVAADLSAIVARADQRRASSAQLMIETEALIGELERVLARSAALLEAMGARRAPS